MRLGVLGGTFDPIHFGHLRAAESIRETMRLDHVIFVPASVPPHKPGFSSTASAEERFHMVAAAVKGSPHFSVSRIELDREGPSYTIDTLAEIGETRPEAQLFFIIGIDAFREIRSWKRWEDLLSFYSFVVHGRPGYGLAGAYEVVPPGLRSRLVDVGSDPVGESANRPALYLVNALTLNISSTEIRALRRQGRSIRFLVPAEVEDFIIDRRLYQDEPAAERVHRAGGAEGARESIEKT